MSERIKGLAEQAGAEIHGHPGYSTICVNGQDADALMKKFAELIVKECAEVSKNYAGGSMPLSIALAIKEHFGVK